ncbi:ropporin-1-like protein [Sebastes umbrosus]|uniref:ropporin-1-like protein n=1 Tax=Sebastes umbrosus TaxID=72105 RepID=UPI00189DDDAF|nr:ropporin-1-like protein [Sebastes umbrosus]XP_037612121.1 ropporin-1-like protein [Sebastes umbrosus]XP_037612122.1 ropporin-1-like protein [Sebastes umbrosus]XP_037612123.1 ropporin-1-like protein [Sebastes umbrosus]
MHLPDTMYCSQQINIPPELPDILKQFTKAAIRTQPKDLLLWSSAYFNALSKGEILPVKDRLEMNVATQKTDTGLTPGLLKTLHKQLSHRQTCNKEELQKKWKGLCLPMEQLETLLSLGSFGSDIDWMEFFALGCSALGGGLLHSLKYACEILTEDDEGGAARIPFDIFVKLYTYLAHLDGDLSQDYVDKFLSSLQEQVNKQNGMIQVSNFSISRQGGKERWKAIDNRKQVIEVTK